MRRTLIIGYGNPLRGDDAVGHLAAERLQELIHDPDIEVLAVHQLTPELMEPISRADRVLFIDAAAEGEPGSIRRRRAKVGQAARSAGPFRISPAPGFTHQAEPAALLAGARTLFGQAPPAWLVTIAGGNFELGGNLSAPVARALDRLVAAIVRRAA